MNKRLSIRLSTDGFSFYTLKGWQHHHVDEGAKFCEELDAAIRKLIKLKADYTDVTLLADYPSTRVPLDEFRSENEQAIYMLTFGDDCLHGLSVQHEVIPGLDVVELFPINLEAKNIVLKYFPNALVQGFCAQMVQESYSDYRLKAGEHKRLYATVEGSELFLCCFSDNGLTFANSYPEKKTSNKLYFILYAWTQMGMDQNEDTLVLYGKDVELESLLHKYILNIECVS